MNDHVLLLLPFWPQWDQTFLLHTKRSLNRFHNVHQYIMYMMYYLYRIEITHVKQYFMQFKLSFYQ